MGLTRPRAHQLGPDSDYKQSVLVVTTTNVTLSGGAPNIVDGVSLSVRDRILVTGQTTASENGIYKVSVLGTGSNGTWIRTHDADEDPEITAGLTVRVASGTTNSGTQWVLNTEDPITVGTTNLSFSELESGSTFDAANISGNLIPSANVTYSIGSPTKQWKDMYVGPGSLYVGGQKVLESDAGTIQVTADVDQSLTIKTTGTGVTTIQSVAGVSLSTSGTADITVTAAGQLEIDSDMSINSAKSINSSDGNPITFGDAISLSNNNISNVSTITATAFSGSGASLTNINASNISSGTLPDARISSSSITQHQASLSITESQISDLGTYATTSSLATVATSGSYNDLINQPTIPTNNNQLTNGAGYITDYTVTQGDVTAHQASLSITESQISDLGSYIEPTSATGAIQLPVGTTAQRPVSPSVGMIRFNTDTNHFEGWTGSIWIHLDTTYG